MAAVTTYRIEEDQLYIEPHGRITTDNAAEEEEEILRICCEHPDRIPVLDAADLLYISSAGLRVLLRLRKQNPELSVINVSAELYETFEMTGFTEMMPIRKAYRLVSVDGCEVIGRGAKGTVYRYDKETIIKVYNDPDCSEEIDHERELARKAFILGIPTAIPFDVVRVGDRMGSVFELLNARSLSEMIAAETSHLDEYVALLAGMLRQVHATEVRAEDMPDAKLTPLLWVSEDRRQLDPADADKLERLIREIPDRLTVIQGDYHTNNLMIQNGEALLIDLDTLSRGHPIFDLVNAYFTYKGMTEIEPDNTMNFLGIPAQTAMELWDKFLPAYLQTDDHEYIAETEKKIQLLSYARMLRHVSRRGTETEKGRQAVRFCRDRIHEMLTETDTLVF